MITTRFATFALLVTPALAAAQSPRAQLQYDSAYTAWQHGDYITALTGLRRVLSGADGARFLKPAALLTGEYYRTTEITRPNQHVVSIAAGNAPEWSPDGRHFVFETTTGGNRVVHLYRFANRQAQEVAQMPGSGATFSTDGSRLAFLRIDEDDQLRNARAELARAPRGEQQRLQQSIAQMESAKSVIVERDLANGRETVINATGVSRGGLIYGDATQLFLSGSSQGSNEVQLYRISGGEPSVITAGAQPKRPVTALANNRILLNLGPNTFGILELGTNNLRAYEGTAVSVSSRGDAMVYLNRNGTDNTIYVLRGSDPAPIIVKTTPTQILNPAISPDGNRVVFQMMQREDWELYTIDITGKNERRLTREIQHDHTPRFLNDTRVLGVIGENRHRRSYVYDLTTGERSRLFHNNQIRTVSMEYAWAPSPDGSAIVIVSDRDGDTISPERGVYVIDLGNPVSSQDVLARIETMARAEQSLRDRGRAMFAPIAAQVRQVVQQADVSRVYSYEKAMFEFDSKHITQPGNQKAAEYIFATLKDFGYEPELQYFEPRPGIRTANVIATLKGTRDPHLVYVVSSHYDSVERGPGADDDTSGSAALLEAARILAGKPMPVTIKFAWFTGEEAGLLGSREFVRQAVASRMLIIGALNNDMIGFANDERLDNTIRYSNVGLRDLQHSAAFLFTNLITYDSKYYQSTDAHAYYDAYGDIVGGIGSYPILGNPHYHQPHDVLETINHQLVTEVAKTTAASLMLMASSPSRINDVNPVKTATGVSVTWRPAPESGIGAYVVRYGPLVNGVPSKTVRATTPQAVLPDGKAGEPVWVKAINAQGIESWDWARAVVR